MKPDPTLQGDKHSDDFEVHKGIKHTRKSTSIE
jgi:hypothetical protein